MTAAQMHWIFTGALQSHRSMPAKTEAAEQYETVMSVDAFESGCTNV